ncbi:helix-turn-helix domain-containing protein [Fuchsiella alkaliacetigena]|uniref:helix-turn-helix domain-containing protein n=1 Tax=Fuchsiella alkaliacetigena TaxID=957042 RepID=UPI00200A4C64|nr:helix-turn-helix transcriptional regulator [Fuchsiella alkaliacetigena]MCK8825977.1 helix-turn-helix domain-containing protein [Fuchsiella alkaliacetigena]
MDIGKRIKKLRKEKNWTFKELNKETGISISFLNNIEKGRSNPSIDNLEKIADAFEVTIAYLLGQGRIEDFDQETAELIDNFSKKDSLKKIFMELKDLDDENAEKLLKTIKLIKDLDF